MTEVIQQSQSTEKHSIIDVFRVLFAILVIGIHTEPFKFNIWLDRGFGFLTRLCVPFFFVISAYFLFKGKVDIKRYLKRIVTLYLVWSVIYLPFSLKYIFNTKALNVVLRYFWYGNEYALWYLWGTVIATLFVFVLIRTFSSESVVLELTVGLFLIGLLGSTWFPIVENTRGVYIVERFTSIVGARSGLLYGAVYVAMGWYLANKSNLLKKRLCATFFIASLFALAIESFIFVVVLNTSSTILWLSVLFATYFGIQYLLQWRVTRFKINGKVLRKISSLMYVSQYLFILCFEKFYSGMLLFLIVTCLTTVFSCAVVILSDRFRWLKILY